MNFQRASKLFDVNHATIGRWARSGKLRVKRDNGWEKILDEQSVHELCLERGIPSPFADKFSARKNGQADSDGYADLREWEGFPIPQACLDEICASGEDLDLNVCADAFNAGGYFQTAVIVKDGELQPRVVRGGEKVCDTRILSAKDGKPIPSLEGKPRVVCEDDRLCFGEGPCWIPVEVLLEDASESQKRIVHEIFGWSDSDAVVAQSLEHEAVLQVIAAPRGPKKNGKRKPSSAKPRKPFRQNGTSPLSSVRA